LQNVLFFATVDWIPCYWML